MKKFLKVALRLLFGLLIYFSLSFLFHVFTSFMPGHVVRLALISFCVWISGKILESKKATIICLVVTLLLGSIGYLLARKPAYYESVYCSAQSTEYHLDKDCPRLNGSKHLYRISSDSAISRGYSPCPHCTKILYLFDK